MKQTLFFLLVIATLFSQGQTTRRFLTGLEYLADVDSINARLKKDPNNADLYYQRSVILFQNSPNHDYAKAFADINKAISLKPDTGKFYVQRAELYEYRDSLDVAISEFTKAIELLPTNGEIYKKRGVLFVKKDDYPKACLDFKKGDELGEPYCKNFIGSYCR